MAAMKTGHHFLPLKPLSLSLSSLYKLDAELLSSPPLPELSSSPSSLSLSHSPTLSLEFVYAVAVVARTGACPWNTPATVPTPFVNRPPSVEPHRNSRPTVQTHRRSYAVRHRRDRATHQLDHPRLAVPRPNPSIHHKVENNPKY
jgi:hypothetical protein